MPAGVQSVSPTAGSRTGSPVGEDSGPEGAADDGNRFRRLHVPASPHIQPGCSDQDEGAAGESGAIHDRAVGRWLSSGCCHHLRLPLGRG